MNTIYQSIRAAFGPETAFVLSLQSSAPIDDEKEPVARASDERQTIRSVELRGIPHSALND